MEVFPVEIALRGETIWLGWVSPEDGHSFFLTSNGNLVFSRDSKEELTREVMMAFPDSKVEAESSFDFSSIKEKFDKGIFLEGDFALDTWNLLTDLYYTFDSDGRIFSETSVEAYRRLFSQSEAALMVDVQRVQLSARDIDLVRDVLMEGVEFLTQKVRLAKAARSH